MSGKTRVFSAGKTLFVADVGKIPIKWKKY
jgi:hypothetical protein